MIFTLINILIEIKNLLGINIIIIFFYSYRLYFVTSGYVQSILVQ